MFAQFTKYGVVQGEHRQKGSFLPVRHNPRSKGHDMLPEGTAPLLLAQASRAQAQTAVWGETKQAGALQHRLRFKALLKKWKRADPHLKLSCGRDHPVPGAHKRPHASLGPKKIVHCTRIQAR